MDKQLWPENEVVQYIFTWKCGRTLCFNLKIKLYALQFHLKIGSYIIFWKLNFKTFKSWKCQIKPMLLEVDIFVWTVKALPDRGCVPIFFGKCQFSQHQSILPIYQFCKLCQFCQSYQNVNSAAGPWHRGRDPSLLLKIRFYNFVIFVNFPNVVNFFKMSTLKQGLGKSGRVQTFLLNVKFENNSPKCRFCQFCQSFQKVNFAAVGVSKLFC